MRRDGNDLKQIARALNAAVTTRMGGHVIEPTSGSSIDMTVADLTRRDSPTA